MSLTTRTGSLEGKRFGNYIAFEMIGQGGMGSVYLAEHPEIGRKVAIKVLNKNHSEEMVQRFLDEAKAVTKIGHPNIIDIYDFGRTGSGRLYYVMEWLDGRELRAVMNEKMPMNAFEVLPYVEQVCAAIQAAHEQGVVHRDLKPANIYVLGQEPLKVKVLDFGVAKLLDTQMSSGITNPGILIGTPMFSAPEQAAAELDRICPQTDLYSLGVLLYWMLTGQPPFMADNNSVLLAMHITDKPKPPRELMPSIPPAIAELLERCLAKDPEERPATARGLAAAWAAGLKRDDAKPGQDANFDDGPSGVLVFLPETPVEEVNADPSEPTGDDDRPEPVAGETDSGDDEDDEEKPLPDKSVEVTERPTHGETPGTKLPDDGGEAGKAGKASEAGKAGKARSDAEELAAFLASGAESPADTSSAVKGEAVIPTPKPKAKAKEEPVVPAPRPKKPEVKTSLTPMSALNAHKPLPALQPEPALTTDPGLDDEVLPETFVEATVRAGPGEAPPAASTAPPPEAAAKGSTEPEESEEPEEPETVIERPAETVLKPFDPKDKPALASEQPGVEPDEQAVKPDKTGQERATSAVKPLSLPAAPTEPASNLWLWGLVALAVAVAVAVAILS